MANEAYQKFINFFQKHNLYDKEIFDYLRLNSILFDYHDEDTRPFIGCYHILDKDLKLKKIQLCIPFIMDEKTILINIHEYTHGILLYKYLNKKIKINNDCETLPLLMERIYLEENPNQELKEYIEKLNTKIQKDTSIEAQKYKIALSIQEELLTYYNKTHNFDKVKNKSKKLYRKQHVK